MARFSAHFLTKTLTLDYNHLEVEDAAFAIQYQSTIVQQVKSQNRVFGAMITPGVLGSSCGVRIFKLGVIEDRRPFVI